MKDELREAYQDITILLVDGMRAVDQSKLLDRSQAWLEDPINSVERPLLCSRISIHETVEQWESRTGETYPDDGPVWRTEVLKDSKGEYIVHHLTTWKNYKPYGSPEVIAKWLKSNQPIIANHNGKP